MRMGRDRIRNVVRCVLCRRQIFAPATVRTPICGGCILNRKVSEEWTAK